MSFLYFRPQLSATSYKRNLPWLPQLYSKQDPQKASGECGIYWLVLLLLHVPCVYDLAPEMDCKFFVERNIHYTSTVRKCCREFMMSRMLRQVRSAALVGTIWELKKLIDQKEFKNPFIWWKKVLIINLKSGEFEMKEGKYWLETIDVWPRVFRGRRNLFHI